MEQVHRIVVTARDGGSEPRLATATVTVLVGDIPDENPKFTQSKYEASVPENHVDYVVVQVQVVHLESFYFRHKTFNNLDNSRTIELVIIYLEIFSKDQLLLKSNLAESRKILNFKIS
jgi:hypothetical protein